MDHEESLSRLGFLYAARLVSLSLVYAWETAVTGSLPLDANCSIVTLYERN